MNRKVELDLLQLVDECFEVAKSKFRASLCLLNSVKIMSNARGGGDFRNFWVGPWNP